jgi:hypothetical protein
VRAVTTTSTPRTSPASASSGWATTVEVRTPLRTRRSPEIESAAVDAQVSAISARQISSSTGSVASSSPWPSNKATPSVPVSPRKKGAAVAADSASRPWRSARAASDAVCSAACTARSVGVATTRRVRTTRTAATAANSSATASVSAI